MDRNKNLAKYIKKEISYDGDGGEICPHCNKYTKEPRYWIDHKSSLSYNIAEFLGLKVGDKIYGLLEDADIYITGKSSKDSICLADMIIESLYTVKSN